MLVALTSLFRFIFPRCLALPYIPEVYRMDVGTDGAGLVPMHSFQNCIRVTSDLPSAGVVFSGSRPGRFQFRCDIGMGEWQSAPRRL